MLNDPIGDIVNLQAEAIYNVQNAPRPVSRYDWREAAFRASEDSFEAETKSAYYASFFDFDNDYSSFYDGFFASGTDLKGYFDALKNAGNQERASDYGKLDGPIGQTGDQTDPFSFIIASVQIGVGVQILFRDPGWNYVSYNWLQTVSSSGEFEKRHHIKKLTDPHIDGPRDENHKLLHEPFYLGVGHPDLAKSVYAKYNLTSIFDDNPIGEKWFKAETTLLGINADGTIVALGSYIWGYTQAVRGKYIFTGPTFSQNPSSAQQAFINDYNQKK